MRYNAANTVERMRELVAARVPFVHQGRTLAGMDCVGALCYALQYEGDVPSYPRDPVNGELERALRRLFGEPVFYRANLRTDPLVSNAQLRPGDVLSMQYAGPVRHVGVIGDYRPVPGELSLLHTSASVGRVVEHVFDERWRRRVVGVWRP